MTNAEDVRAERHVGQVRQLLEAVFRVASEAIVVQFHRWAFLLEPLMFVKRGRVPFANDVNKK